jgi:raffinose/stachyose/melibiose transport system substrate-binding protein
LQPANLVEMTKEKYVSDLTTAVKSFYMPEGKIYGVPWGGYNAMGVLYNMRVFSRLGIEVPGNWDEFLAARGRFKQSGVTPIFEAVKTGWPVQIFFLTGFQTFVLPTIGGMEGVKKSRTTR